MDNGQFSAGIDRGIDGRDAVTAPSRFRHGVAPKRW
jgi:hypothetical protein